MVVGVTCTMVSVSSGYEILKEKKRKKFNSSDKFRPKSRLTAELSYAKEITYGRRLNSPSRLLM